MPTNSTTASRRLFRLTDTRIRLLVLLVILTVFAVINPTVISVTNIIALINNSIFSGVCALGLLVVMVTGNLDLSMMAIAMMSGFGTVYLFRAIGYPGDYFTMFLVAGLIGMCCGIVNGLITCKFDLPGFVVSIGTQLVFSSLLFVLFPGGYYIASNDMPQRIVRLSYDYIFELQMASGTTARLSIGFALLLFAAVFVWILLNKTQIGRGIYALGGDKVALERVGYNKTKVYTVAYATFGFLLGAAGMFFFANQQACEANTIMGKESGVIAAAIFGGCNMKNGKGTVGGTLVGVAIITLINDNLVMLGVVPYAKILVIGSIILISVLVSSLGEIKRSKL